VSTDDVRRSWVALVQAEAERGIVTCRMCRRPSGLDEALTVWRNGCLVFAVCDRCAATHEVLLRATERGLEVRGRERGPLLVGGSR
jgi:hypothetical protein